MRKILWLFFSITGLVTLFLFVIVPYIQEQKRIEHYAFDLDSSQGKVHLSDFKGKISIIYFGYMYCPDICPTSLSLIAHAIEQLPKEKASAIQVIFISVDPQRDNLKALEEYAHYFYPSAIGLTANEEYLKKITANYGTYYVKEGQKGALEDYAITHTSYIYIMNQKGDMVQKLPHMEDSKMLLEALLTLL